MESLALWFFKILGLFGLAKGGLVFFGGVVEWVGDKNDFVVVERFSWGDGFVVEDW